MADPNDQMTSTQRHRLLELLATSDEGCTADLLLALGFTPDLVLGVVRARLATAETENVLAGGRAVVVSRADYRGWATGASGTVGCVSRQVCRLGKLCWPIYSRTPHCARMRLRAATQLASYRS